MIVWTLVIVAGLGMIGAAVDQRTLWEYLVPRVAVICGASVVLTAAGAFGVIGLWLPLTLFWLACILVLAGVVADVFRWCFR